jgi:beta,beta-carotene 9',10'-dioxygenase
MSRPPYYLGFTTLASETRVDALPLRGVVPGWLKGTLVRTGPARFEVGNRTYNHWFDGLAMLHGFGFASGRVSYANRYLQSRSYQEAMARGTISRGEYATDPCRTLFQRRLRATEGRPQAQSLGRCPSSARKAAPHPRSARRPARG